ALVENLIFPGSECLHLSPTRAASAQLDARADPAHQLCSLLGNATVFVGGLFANLPAPILLVAAAPEPDTTRSCAAAPAPQLRALFDRPDTVFPVVARKEIPAGVANQGNAEFSGQRQHILAKSPFVGFGVSGLEYASVDAAAHMFDEAPEEPRIDCSYFKADV